MALRKSPPGRPGALRAGCSNLDVNFFSFKQLKGLHKNRCRMLASPLRALQGSPGRRISTGFSTSAAENADTAGVTTPPYTLARPTGCLLTFAPKLRLAPLWPALAAIALAAIAGGAPPAALAARRGDRASWRRSRAFSRRRSAARADGHAGADGALERRIAAARAGTALPHHGHRARRHRGRRQRAGAYEALAAMDNHRRSARRSRRRWRAAKAARVRQQRHDRATRRSTPRAWCATPTAARWVLRLGQPLSTVSRAAAQRWRGSCCSSALAAAALVLAGLLVADALALPAALAS